MAKDICCNAYTLFKGLAGGVAFDTLGTMRRHVKQWSEHLPYLLKKRMDANGCEVMQDQ